MTTTASRRRARPYAHPADEGGGPVRRLARPHVVLALLAVALAVVCVLAAGIGAVGIPPEQVLATVAHRAGLHVGSVTSENAAVLWQIRLPRVALGVLVGASLGCAGAIMQGIFGNPLADPGIVGVSSGAAVGAVVTIVSGAFVFGRWSVTVAAFVGGVLTTVLVYLIARSHGRTEVVTLILTGIAVNALAGAAIGLCTFLATNEQLQDITFWNLGSLSAATWQAVAAVAPCAALGQAIAPPYAPSLDLHSLGESSARHLGVDVERLRIVLILVVGLLVSAAVAVCGVVGFVGLVVPHLIRLMIGPAHRTLIAGSALGGAIVVVAGDLAARTIVLPAEAPLGVLTALLGAPFFLWLLRRTRRSQGGWA